MQRGRGGKKGIHRGVNKRYDEPYLSLSVSGLLGDDDDDYDYDTYDDNKGKAKSKL